VLLFPETVSGTKVALAPPGRPDAEKATSPVKPPLLLMVTVRSESAPCWILRLDAERAREKAGTGASVTVREKVAVASVTPLPLAVMVMVEVPGAELPPTDTSNWTFEDDIFTYMDISAFV
jgi:hypothetical protein